MSHLYPTIGPWIQVLFLPGASLQTAQQNLVDNLIYIAANAKTKQFHRSYKNWRGEMSMQRLNFIHTWTEETMFWNQSCATGRLSDEFSHQVEMGLTEEKFWGVLCVWTSQMQSPLESGSCYTTGSCHRLQEAARRLIYNLLTTNESITTAIPHLF